jgi:hypothetical protein
MPMSESLTASELEQLRALLQRFTEHDLDQFGNLRFDTSYGPVFVLFTRELLPGWSAGAFTPVSRPAPADTGRCAHVRDVATVNSRDGVLQVIKEMHDDLASTGASEWENPNLERFLDGLHAFLADLDGYYAKRGQRPPAQPNWGLFATALVTATGYE